jgi:hypothetical protein
MKKNILWTILLSAFLICTAQPSYGSILIGRVTHVEGKVLTYSEDEEDWVETGPNTPVGAEDGFYTDEGARAELIFPNDTMLRMGEATEVDILRIEKEFTEIYIRTGTVRVYSRDLDAEVKVGTAMGYAEIPSQGTADFFVDNRSTEIVSIQKDILFHKTVGADAPETYELRAGSNPLIVSIRHVETGRALSNTSWDKWCLERDMVLKEQAAIRSAHLPSTLQVYSYELEPYGEWERMRYRGYYYWFWRPVRVSIGWTPFTRGLWNRWHREYVWISSEPWGWCTHHYGNWVNLNGGWRWTPYIHVGVSSPGISFVHLDIHFGKSFRPHWHPGRIAWVSTTSHVGWIPLAPWETYYGYRKWGPRTVVVKYKDKPKRRSRKNRYAYRDHSVFIPQKEFRPITPNRQHDYRRLMETGVKKKALLKNSIPTYGHHKMAIEQQDVRKGKRNDRAERQRSITKPKNTFRSSPPPPVNVARERAILTSKKKTTLPRKETGDRVTKITKRPETTSRQPSTLQRGQRTERNTVPPISRQALNSQPSNNSQKWVGQQSRERRGAKERNTTSVKVSKERKLMKPEKKTTPPRKETGDRVTKITKRPETTSRQSSALQRAQSIKRNTVPLNIKQSVKSQSSENQKKWASQQPQQKWRDKGSNTIPRQRRR